MKYQCTFCDINAESLNDEKFEACKTKQHRIIPMLTAKEANTNSKSSKKILKKVKGFVADYYVESVLVDGKPCFLCVSTDNGIISTREVIESEEIIYKPLEEAECGYFPYGFTRSEIANLNCEIPKDDLFDDIHAQIDRFVSLRELDKNLILGDIFLTYCQEWISTLHYPFFVGETESGKSTVLHLVKWLGYRCHLGEDIPTADIYNYLGIDEEGTGTIAEDEAQELDGNKEKIRMHKSSYAKGSQKARIIGVDSLGKHQVFYKTFCSKWFAGEKVPADKGFLERLAIVHMTEGQPQSNIKRLHADEMNQLNILRNRMLVWKLQNINRGLERIESGLKQRDQELWEDFLSVANKTKYFDKCKNVVQYYVTQRHAAIKNSLEARLFKFVLDKIDHSLELKFEDYWAYITTDNLEFVGKLDEKSTKTFYPEDFAGKITYHTISKIFDDKFQATRQTKVTRSEDGKQHKVTLYTFKKDTVEKLVHKYDTELDIDNPFYVGQHGQQESHEEYHSTQVGLAKKGVITK